MLKEVDIENIKEALRNNSNLLLYSARDSGLVIAALINEIGQRRWKMTTYTSMPTDEGALLWLNLNCHSKEVFLDNPHSQPEREDINPRHKWLKEGGKILVSYQKEEFVFQAVCGKQYRVIESSKGRDFIPAYYSLDVILNELSFNTLKYL